MQANDHTELHMQATRSGSEEDDSPQRAAHAPDRRGWSQEDVATLKKGMQVHGHHWSKIQVGLLLSSCAARCMATSRGGRAAGPAAGATQVSQLQGKARKELRQVVGWA